MATSWVVKSTETTLGAYGVYGATRNYALGTTETTELAVNDWVDSNAPLTYTAKTGRTLALEKIKTVPLGGGIWDVVLDYSLPKFESADSSAEGPVVTYNGGVSTTKVYSTISNQTRYTRDGETAPDVRNNINVTQDGTQGVDILTPIADFTVEKTHEAGTFTTAILRDLYLMQCTTNDGLWKNWQRGEVLFESFSVSIRGDRKEVSRAKFLVSPNDSEITVDANGDSNSDEGITPIEKYGWQYLWSMSLEKPVDSSSTGQGVHRKRVLGVYVGDVYYETDFDNLNLLV